MYLETLRNNEIERIAYLTGDTMAAMAFGDLDESIGEVARLENDLEKAQSETARLQEELDNLEASKSSDGHSETLASVLTTIATAFQLPSKPTRKHLDAMARAILEITARPGDYTPESARTAIYSAFGHDV